MKMRTLSLAAAGLLLIGGTVDVGAQDHTGHAAMHGESADSAAVASALSAFHGALVQGDTATALGLLAPDARILEGGGIETVEEYASHHLPGDMAFAAAVARDRGPLSVWVHGDIAWVTSTSRVTGTYRNREIDSRGAELAVLSRTADGWKIQAIHWSSR